jgi:uncharacterized protein YggE
MKNILIITCLLFLSPMFSQNGTKNFIDQNYIEITGVSESELTPDEIYLSIVIHEKDKKGKISVEQQETAMIKKLKQLDLNMKNDFKILDYTSNYKFYFLKRTDIQKSKKYQLMVRDGLTLGKVFQTLESIEISNVSISKISHSKIEEHTRVAKIRALKAAKQKALDYAEAIDQTIGKALYIQENQRNFRPQYSNEITVRGMTTSKFQQEAINDIEFEKIKIHASVLARFELK